ncbi:MAG: alpha/beta hydrolase [Actinomycetota bacterium]|nr:alpha/beta hydrolase [Actinomycetota bacterium]
MIGPDERGTIDGPAGAIGWRRFGEGPPLLAINGFTGNKEDWNEIFLYSLALGSTVICADLRGTGETEGGVEGLTVETMASDMQALLDGLALDRVDLLGWSMGGFVVQELAVRIPDRVKALCLLSTDQGGPEAVRSDPAVIRALADPTGTTGEQVRRQLELVLPPDWADRVFGVAGEVLSARRTGDAPDLITARAQAWERWYERTDPPIGRIEELTADGLPVLICCGLEDRVIPPVNSEMISTRLPGAWLAPFTGGHHSLMSQEPRRLGDLIGVFLGHPGLR